MSSVVLNEATPELEMAQQVRATKPDQAIVHLTNALCAGGRTLEMFVDLGCLLLDARKYEEVWKACELGLQFHPRQRKLLELQGSALAQLCYFEEALACFYQSSAGSSKDDRPWLQIGSVLRLMGSPQKAIKAFQRVKDQDSYVLFCLASTYLVSGDWDKGFQYFARRPMLLRNSLPNRPLWDGQASTKFLALYNDQGIGDLIQCLRYFPLLNQRGITPILGASRALTRLLEAMPGERLLVHSAEGADPADYQCALLSLPGLFQTTPDNVPPPVPFSLREAVTTYWSNRLRRYAGRRVGLVWAGNPDHQNDHNRSLALRALEPIWSQPDICFFGLQMGDAAKQIAQLGWQQHIVDLSPEITDYADTAAILSQIDLLITVDTSVAHLAGTQGIPVWTLLPYGPDWRWMLNRDDSPWYPSMRLFRQPKPRDWEGVIARVGVALAKRPHCQAAARLIPSGASILDLHAGADEVRHYISADCIYQGCNIQEAELPATCKVDLVTLIGVLDQVENWQGLLTYLRGLDRPALVSYHPADATTRADRDRLGCVNHLRLAELVVAISESGFTIQDSIAADATEAVLKLSPRAA